MWIQEMFTDLYESVADLEDRLKDDAIRMEDKRAISARLRKLYKALGEHDATMGEDPLIDKWERELAEGRTPNLDE